MYNLIAMSIHYNMQLMILTYNIITILSLYDITLKKIAFSNISLCSFMNIFFFFLAKGNFTNFKAKKY